MEKYEDNVLKKLARRRKMFEDYITLVKRPDGVKGIMRREMWDVRREKFKEPKKATGMLAVRRSIGNVKVGHEE
ncbi:hypothetical protein ACOBQJ_10440 [Pelotomaculum propionicicum]|uniref:hypothetical protein n=1 Tax=Pelotomaculum propionicicum TaxID=258475 RepID=UPI003B7C4552